LNNCSGQLFSVCFCSDYCYRWQQLLRSPPIPKLHVHESKSRGTLQEKQILAIQFDLTGWKATRLIIQPQLTGVEKSEIVTTPDDGVRWIISAEYQVIGCSGRSCQRSNNVQWIVILWHINGKINLLVVLANVTPNAPDGGLTWPPIPVTDVGEPVLKYFKEKWFKKCWMETGLNHSCACNTEFLLMNKQIDIVTWFPMQSLWPRCCRCRHQHNLPWCNVDQTRILRRTFDSHTSLRNTTIQIDWIHQLKANQIWNNETDTWLGSKFGMIVVEGQPPKKTFCDWTQTRQLATATKNSIEEDLNMFVYRPTSRKALTDYRPAAQYLYPTLNVQNCICLDTKLYPALMQHRQKQTEIKEHMISNMRMNNHLELTFYNRTLARSNQSMKHQLLTTQDTNIYWSDLSLHEGILKITQTETERDWKRELLNNILQLLLS